MKSDSPWIAPIASRSLWPVLVFGGITERESFIGSPLSYNTSHSTGAPRAIWCTVQGECKMVGLSNMKYEDSTGPSSACVAWTVVCRYFIELEDAVWRRALTLIVGVFSSCVR